MPRSSKPIALAALAFLGCAAKGTVLGGVTGYSHTCAIVSGGALCWGDNSQGQIGDELTGTPATSPAQVFGLTSGVTAIAGGGFHTCAVVSGAAQCWGANYYGQLGNSSTSTVANTPVPVLGLSSDVSALAAGYSHSCAVAGGGVLCWGSNANGQLGGGSAGGISLVPVAVPSLTVGVEALAAGYAHSCALQNGGVLCFGSNSNGQLGNGTTADSSVPVAVTGLAGPVLAVAAGAGSLHSCALLESGEVWCWGANSSGQLGNGTTADSSVPVQVTGLPGGAVGIAAGALHSCALLGSGGAWCWGYGGNGQLGNGSTASSAVPVAVLGVANGTGIAAGGTHACFLAGGNVQCWGENQLGQLGNGTLTDSSVPVSVQ